MTRDEITSLLEMLVANYPNTKIRDPKATADSWEMTLGMYQAESVFKAARYHMDTSTFFPTPADIKKKMVRAKLIYDEPLKVTAIPSPKSVSDEKVLEYIDAVCEWVGFGTEEDDTALDRFYDKNPDMVGMLPYEE